MRLALIGTASGPRVAVDFGDSLALTAHRSLLDVIDGDGSALAELGRELPNLERVAPASVRFLAPIQRPGKVICAGINYHSHLDENPKATLPQRPFFFAKLPSSVVGPGDPIVKLDRDSQLDPEVELGVVVGRTARNLDRSSALDAVFGYTVVNDVSAREWQFAPDAQFMLGKAQDGFCPLGPVVVTRDEIPDPGALRLSTTVNGERRQDSTTAECIFDVARLLEVLTRYVTLEPGDVISTGTPAGVGLFRSPQVWLQPGDEVVLEIEKIGVLRNPVVAGWREP
jgi:2-keto-4-pentenoate hydratase/2-oxohepta-3-ene-1,7-dioic acid hydratase in catechol pathway